MKRVERLYLGEARKSLRALDAFVAEIDRELRYVWIDNLHVDFDLAIVIGKRDDELLPEAEALPLMALKREVFDTRQAASCVLSFNLGEGLCFYSVFAYPIFDASAQVDGLLVVGFDSPAPEGWTG
jgi:hypothetical protein